MPFGASMRHHEPDCAFAIFTFHQTIRGVIMMVGNIHAIHAGSVSTFVTENCGDGCDGTCEHVGEVPLYAT